MKKRMSEGVRDMDPEKGTAERKARLEKKRGMKLDDHPQYKKEEVEQVDENRAAARAAGGYKDDSKKQPDPSKKGFTGVGNMSIDAIRKMSARIEKEKTQKEEVEVDEAVKGQDTEMRKAGAAERRMGDKKLSVKQGEQNADKMQRDIKFFGKLTRKESFSNWRTDLSEVMTDEIDSKPVKEKKINNKIKINPQTW